MYEVRYSLEGYETEFKEVVETLEEAQRFYTAIQENVVGTFSIYGQNACWQFFKLDLSEYRAIYENPQPDCKSSENAPPKGETIGKEIPEGEGADE